MTIQSLSESDLLMLVRYGSERFSAEAKQELAARSQQPQQSEEQRPVEAQVVAFPSGRWSQ